jgi:DNA-binding winged helix-turn-helix (wHTH) protein/TolB-like protein/tetratricopeptide (TPR) repeat protein
MLTAVKRIYRFADFTLDTSEHRLLRGREEIYLPPKTFETLLYLVERHGHLIKKNELLDTLWADAFVTENALTRCVKEVREALQDDAHQPRYIRTFPRVGYKFIAEVEEIPIPVESEEFGATKIVPGEKVGEDTSRLEKLAVAGAGVLTAEPVRAPPPERRTSWALTRKTLLVPLAGAALILIVLLAYYLRPKQVPPPVQIRSIAVLPFKPLVVEASDDSLQLGMADTLITTLSNVSQITVRPTSAVRKYTGLEQDSVVAGREQRVDAVLDGSIQKLGDRIRVTVRLLRVADGAQLWASKFDEKSADIFLVQDSISKQVADALAVKLTGAERELLTKHYTGDTEAYQLYLKGRYFLNKSTGEDFKKSIEYFQQALARDPNYALAQAGLADSYAQLGSYGLIQMKDSYPRARVALTRALESDDKLGEAHASLGFILMNYYWDWAEAERRFKRAIELNPNYAMAHNWYSQHLAFTGRSQEAIREAKRAQEIDPISPWTNSDIGFVSYLARQYDEAILASQKTLELDPDFAVAHMIIGLSYVQKHRYDEGIAELQRAKANPDSRALLAYAYAVAGESREARKILKELDQLSKQKYVSPFPIAVAYSGLGENDRAFEALEKAYAERSWGMGMLGVNPIFDGLRSDPRFALLLRRVNLAP